MSARFYLSLSFIIICFSCSKEAATEQKDAYLFHEIPSDVSNIDFVNKITEDEEHNIINYIYYYNGGGVAAGDINNDGLEDLFFIANQGKNKLFLNKGNLKFEDISESSGTSGTASWSTGVTMLDINGDGYLDIYVCAVTGLLDFKGHNELFINNGDGSFSEKSKEYGLDFKGFSTQSYFFDYDKDGDLDVYIVNHAIHTTLSHGPASARSKRVPSVGDVLYKNENGKFRDVSEEANIYGGVNSYGLSASIADLNNDGWEDIYVCNDFHEDDYYYINNKDGSFKEALGESFSTIGRFSMGSDAADLNNDGYLDLITLDMLPSDERVLKESEGDDAMFNVNERLERLGYKDQYSRNMLQINNSGDFFYEAGIFNGISNTDWSWAPLIADFDNDGHQDLFVTNGILRRPNDMDFKQYVSSALKKGGSQRVTEWLYKSIDEMPSGKVANRIFKGDSNKFSDKSGVWLERTPSLSNGAIYVDLDGDGDLDLVTNNLNTHAGVYENTSDDTKNHLSVRVRFKDENIEGVGTRVILFTKDKVQTKTLSKSRGFLSSVASGLHFGLDTISRIDSLQIIWPDLSLQTILSPVINQNLDVAYTDEKRQYTYQPKQDQYAGYFQETDAIVYAHAEDSFYDSYHQRLIPYRVSMQGPALAIDDVDGNGFDDVFIGSAAGHKPQLYSNNGVGFSSFKIPAIEKDSMFEDNDAHFFDADNDGDLDLYVASGISSSKSTGYHDDRLYINEKGNFKRSENRIPLNAMNASVVISSDYDLDGDADLFVGNLSDPTDFGYPVRSMLLQNDGKGNFSLNEKFELLANVNDAIWEDLDGDGRQDLLIAAEWDKPRVFMNLDIGFKEIEIAEKTKGLWQTISMFDIDGDGDKDIVLGNWGLNTKFSLNDGPLKMYHSDFDEDGKNEVLVAYSVEGEYYPIHSKDELGSQMKSVSKKFVNYSDFALKTIEEIVGSTALGTSTKFEVEELASGYLENDGGSFKKFVPFTDQLQMAPISSFSELEIDGVNRLLVSGNSFKVNAYHGGYTSLKGALLSNDGKVETLARFGVLPFAGQIKATASIAMRHKNLLLVLENNAEAKTYSYKKGQ